MSLDIEEKLVVRAPVDKVWDFLINPEKIVTCLPGAELTKVEDERTFLGNMKVKVGPVTVSYQGRVKLTEVDDGAHRVKMSGEGTEKGGAGSARMSMESHVVPVDGGSEITVLSKVDLAGKIVQFGRGMVKGVAQQLFKQFGQNLRGALETTEEAPSVPAVPEPAIALPVAAAEADKPFEELTTRQLPAQRAPKDIATKPITVPAKREVEPVRIIPIILKVLFAPFLRFFRRLFGRKPA